ncbi:type II toxin-antitoxin system RelE/ParE family toxin [Odoribacter sp. OttesenSCG-928-J03]|nr:type II toxin-antitoxin system RelE/ParE family toxin [Odoribacter sp. OttesenSCG-928-J03]MDL2330641.1 type II toxin-antitoxin system RelE/ParE family toxin [Odoribacter sp. OttesenSCG-928-A06]
MEKERAIIAYKHYFTDFMNSIGRSEARKIAYVLDMLKTQQRVNEKFVKAIRDGLYEIRAEYSGNIYRVFFIFDDGNIVVLFNGFQKKTQKTPSSEIDKALKLKEEYYETKRNK